MSREQFQFIAGVDEVGRGPLAGPVVAAAVILDPRKPIQGLADSKKLSEAKREALSHEIKEKALSWSIARAEIEEIDQINILQASLLAMKRAVETLGQFPQLALIDGNKLPDLACAMEAIIKGDSKEACISAASIIAKVARDEEMVEMDHRYPGYGFAKHKGYPTKQHREAIQTLGITPIHRRSFAPVQKLLF
ncbi:ribonuclease HII [Kangiella sp. HZ709]|uniref:ribonuclease HII n=1 Tax=Kangiella sp. HZ709 TaxID=2666328 RepID=UPI0012B07641|nr:ribonuclease HII [Kangiella sp. HZ709]MRX28316.1 ribonuclease HII [Kangiella sp. HZ709]